MYVYTYVYIYMYTLGIVGIFRSSCKIYSRVYYTVKQYTSKHNCSYLHPREPIIFGSSVCCAGPLDPDRLKPWM